MAGRDGKGLVVASSGELQALFFFTGAGDGHVEELHDGGADAALVGGLPSADHIGDNSCLLVGGACQGDDLGSAGNQIPDGGGVAQSVDVLCAGAQVLVHQNFSPLSQLYAAAGKKAGFGGNADGQDDHIRRNGGAVLKLNGIRSEAGAFLAHVQAHTGGADAVVYHMGHIQIHGRHHVGGGLHHGDLQSPFRQIFRHFQTDEACADDGGSLGLGGFNMVIDGVGVRNVAQGKDVVFLHTRELGPDGGSAGGEDQLIIAFGVGFTGGVVPDGNGFRGGIHGQNLVVHPHIHIEAGMKGFGRLKLQLGTVGDGAADVVGQAAVGKGNEPAFLQQDNLGVFVITAQPGGSTSAAGDTADNQNFHNNSP